MKYKYNYEKIKSLNEVDLIEQLEYRSMKQLSIKYRVNIQDIIITCINQLSRKPNPSQLTLEELEMRNHGLNNEWMLSPERSLIKRIKKNNS